MTSGLRVQHSSTDLQHMARSIDPHIIDHTGHWNVGDHVRYVDDQSSCGKLHLGNRTAPKKSLIVNRPSWTNRKPKPSQNRNPNCNISGNIYVSRKVRFGVFLTQESFSGGALSIHHPNQLCVRFEEKSFIEFARATVRDDSTKYCDKLIK